MAESGSDEEDEDLTRDEFNLNKLIVLVTGAGKVGHIWNVKHLATKFNIKGDKLNQNIKSLSK